MPHPLVVNYRDGGYDVYIGRPSKWENPYPLYDFDSRRDCFAAYTNWLYRSEQRQLLADLGELTGKVLGCGCAPRLCHGELLARLANNPFVVNAYAIR